MEFDEIRTLLEMQEVKVEEGFKSRDKEINDIDN